MSIEIRMLVWSVILGLVQILVAAVAGMGQRGTAWAATHRRVAAMRTLDMEGFPLGYLKFLTAILALVQPLCPAIFSWMSKSVMLP